VSSGHLGEWPPARLLEELAVEALGQRSPTGEGQVSLAARASAVRTSKASLVPDEHGWTADASVPNASSAAAMTHDRHRAAVEAGGWERRLDVDLQHAVDDLGTDDLKVIELERQVDTLAQEGPPCSICLVADRT
jgi:hypothetical protein